LTYIHTYIVAQEKHPYRKWIELKRDLLQCQKRPTTVSKETYYSVKRDLPQCQKRPTTVSKKACCSVKRDLLQMTLMEQLRRPVLYAIEWILTLY